MTLSDDTETVALIATIVWIAIALGLYVWWGWALARLFSILGAPRWRAWVPVVNTAELFRLGGQPSWFVVLGFIPVVNIYALVVYIQALHAITVQMGRGAGMTALGALLGPLWATLLSSEHGKAQSRYAVHPEAIAASADPARAHSGLTPPTPVAGLGHAVPDQDNISFEAAPKQAEQAPMGAPYAVRPAPQTPPVAASSDPYEVWSEPRTSVTPAAEVHATVPAQTKPSDSLDVANAHDHPGIAVEKAAPYLAATPAPLEADEPIEFPSVTEHTPVPPLPLSPVGLPVFDDSPSEPRTPAFLEQESASHAPTPPLWEPQAAASAWPQASHVADNATPPAQPVNAEPTFEVVDISVFEDEDEDGATIMVDRRPVVRWQLTLDSGAAFPITHSTVIIGRKPTSLEGTVQALALPDLTKTLSKVHARLELIGDDWFITDLHSTNGVILTGPSGEEVTVAEGERAKVRGRFVLGKVGMALAVAS